MPEQNNSLYVQYGFDLSAPNGWLNFDASSTSAPLTPIRDRLPAAHVIV